MYLTRMRPEQVREAVRDNLPLIMGSGVVEYHGPHLPIGTDAMIASHICTEVEKRIPCVVAPPIAFGPTMSWAAGPEDGEIDFDPAPFEAYAKELLKRLRMIGFKQIYIVQHHQGMDGLQALSLRHAAAELTREEAQGYGHSWGWRDPSTLPNPNIFGAIQVAGIDTYLRYPSDNLGPMPIGHAGKGETQLIQHIDPETVRMEALDTIEQSRLPEWLMDAKEADADEARFWLDLCVEGWIRHITRAGG
ncbi:creatininase family protein [Paenibacillus sp. OV219]|uniref:creatininase family protein n=1 Tax=Paenibacillus sp. OV219 TaxID=1884377 RepID=UPI0008B0FB27|nr:creatininase family protein [Paenibacillus sp. OV219]SEN80386.1 Creatinine amidohydrolase/Fe(II)-dependent formamide hydrolase involved in riboflavin and F420 biosynthesis [Paenibacillus sp. OV219]